MAATLGLALLHALLGRLNLLLGKDGYPPALWAPAGLAMVGVLFGGYRVAPGVLLGAFVVQLSANLGAGLAETSRMTCLVAATVATGAMLQACLGVFLVRRLVGRSPSLDEARDVGLFLILVGPIASVVNATFATVAYQLAGRDLPAELGLRWATWWSANMTGCLLMAPLLVVWFPFRPQIRGRRLWVTVPVVMAVTLIFVLFVRVDRWEHSRLDVVLRRRAELVTSAMERVSDHYVNVVQSVAAFQHATVDDDPQTFELFVRSSIVPGIRALGWAPRVSAKARLEHETLSAAARGHAYEIGEPDPSGHLRRAADRAEYFPVQLLEPDSANGHVLGVDLASVAPWRVALEQASAAGRTTGLIDSTWLGNGNSILVLLTPVFSKLGRAHDRKLVGFAVGLCSLSALTAVALHGVAREGLDLALYDTDASGVRHLAYATNAPEEARARHQPFVSTSVRIAGHAWSMELFVGKAYVAAERNWQGWLVLTSGILFVVWLQAFLLVMTARTSKVEQLVAQRTHELELSNRAVEQQHAALTHSNAELAAAVDAKEILLRELHHRVKNNLQVIASLFSLQARYLPDARYREIFEESRNRVFSIALAHEKLYGSKDLGRIDFSEYARNLIAHLQAMLSTTDTIQVVTDIHEVKLPVETAIPCGLVINELVTNAFKHAFPDGRAGTIRVVLHEAGGARWLLAIEDDGIGLPPGVAPGQTDSLGLDLVSILATQIGAELQVGREKGTSFRLTFGDRRRAHA